VVALIPLLAWWLFSLPGVVALILLLAWWLFSLAGVVALFMLLLGAPRAVSALLPLGALGRFRRLLLRCLCSPPCMVALIPLLAW